MSSLLKKSRLFLSIVTYTLSLLLDNIARALSARLHVFLYKPPPDPSSIRNVVIVGASFAGYHAAHLLSTSLPPTHRVVVIEPHSHLHFTWAFPRFSVEKGHEHKAFIPYGPHLRRAPPGAVVWKRDAVTRVGRETVVLRSGEEVRYDYLLLATGSSANPPSRMGVDGKEEGITVLKGVSEKIKDAENVVVVGGGAVGVELATDAKSVWPEKRIVLVHSRQSVLGKFGKELRDCALKTMEELGVEVVLAERVKEDGKGEGVVTLSSGRVLPCDYLINCIGQKPASGILAELSPSSIAGSGHIRTRPTMQLADESLPNIYAAGDVAETEAKRANTRSAMNQAAVATDNILLALKGQQPRNQYRYASPEGGILLTLGSNKSVVYVSDNETEILFHSKGKDMSVQSASAWKHMGAKPFEGENEGNDSM